MFMAEVYTRSHAQKNANMESSVSLVYTCYKYSAKDRKIECYPAYIMYILHVLALTYL